jgi:tRNA(His) 5'-end guanylyltransferase
MTSSLSDRQKSYEKPYDFKILPRLPIIIRADGKNFKRLTKNIKKPYSLELIKIMSDTMLHTIMELEGAVFGYHFDDEITFVLKSNTINEDSLFLNNDLQKLVSLVSSLTTLNFMKNYLASDDPPDLLGEALFDVKVFNTPSLNETVNHIIWRQQSCIKKSINNAINNELKLYFNESQITKKTKKQTLTEKKELLLSTCNIDFDSDYAQSYRRGVAVYKVPKIISIGNEKQTRKKWVLDDKLPDFLTSKEFITNIIQSGCDVFRAERDLL